ncbi:hypothetical protein [Pontivivens ytuae]|uniref:Uncharacterized protein n=1 Tax=Pontivivens ytuae TaxID=2789856 RepID=A0A7S9LUV3_9RHOB|nr:hypothetical protein [Pontivivens ytuae]QPH55679.1 hypothetical protein I0K15_08120 [Pontivivens ytuae]
MRRAFAISAGLHALFIALSFGQFELWESEEEPIVITAEVTLMSEAEFDAATSVAPEFVPSEIGLIAAPTALDLDALRPDDEMEVTINDVEGPDDPSEADAEADLSAVLVQNQVSANTQTAALAPNLPQSFDLGISTPNTQPTERRPQQALRPASMTRPTPQRPSLRIDTTPAAPPPEDAEEADERQEEIATGEEANTEEEAQEATAPEEAATEIVPEIAEDLPEPEETPAPLEDDLPETDVAEQEPPAPLTSAPPRARPRPEPEEVEVAEAEEETPVEEAPVEVAEEPEPEPAEEPAEEPAAEEPVETVATAEATADVPTGPPLTPGEIGGFTNAISSKWNIGRVLGMENGESLIVTVAFSLDRSGQVVNDDVRLIRPGSADGPYSIAFQAARSAVLQASRQGAFQLPPDKYGQWQDVEVTFDPSRGAEGVGL